MTKRNYKYSEGDELTVNDKARRGYPSMTGRKVIVHRVMDDSVLYDYEVRYEHDRHALYRFKEEELDYPAPYKGEISC